MHGIRLIKIISKQNNKTIFRLQKPLFCVPKGWFLLSKTAYFERRNNSFCKTLIIKRLDNTHHYKKYLHASLCVLLISLHVTNAVLLYENVLIVRRNSTQKITF